MIRANWSGLARRLLVSGLCGICLLGNLPAKDREVPTGMRAAIDDAIARVKPALVRIRVVSAEYGDGREIKSQEVGSGAICFQGRLYHHESSRGRPRHAHVLHIVES